MLELLADPQAWAALVTLTALEIVLGIDNVVFISILVARLDPVRAERARKVGILLAFVFRVMLLLMLAWIMGLTAPVFTILGNALSWRDLILIGGGLFLVWKATREIHETVDPHAETAGDETKGHGKRAGQVFASVIVQILALDVVFSIDSILTAVGMVDESQQPIMFAAVIIAVAMMMIASGPLAAFIKANPSVVMLALGFLLMIGMTLIADGFGFHVPKGYIYAAMAFSGLIEALNMLARSRRRSVRNRP